MISWQATLGHADLKTTTVYAHARPGERSGRATITLIAISGCERVQKGV
jgi:hypothetical protein